MKGKERGGVFSWWKEKKNLEKEEIFHVFFFHLPFFLSRDAFFNTLKRSRARELKRERDALCMVGHKRERVLGRVLCAVCFFGRVAGDLERV